MKQQYLIILTTFVAHFAATNAFSAPSRYQYGQESSVAIQEMRATIDELRHELNNHETEIRMFEDKISNQEVIIESLREQSLLTTKTAQDTTKGNMANLEMRINSLDTAQKAFVADMKELKNYTNQLLTNYQISQKKIDQLEKLLETESRNMENLQAALKSMMTLFEMKNDLFVTDETKTDEKSKFYRVQPGDSLDKIAKLHKTTIKAIKELNELNSDRIIVGQNIKIP